MGGGGAVRWVFVSSFRAVMGEEGDHPKTDGSLPRHEDNRSRWPVCFLVLRRETSEEEAKGPDVIWLSEMCLEEPPRKKHHLK